MKDKITIRELIFCSFFVFMLTACTLVFADWHIENRPRPVGYVTLNSTQEDPNSSTEAQQIEIIIENSTPRSKPTLEDLEFILRNVSSGYNYSENFTCLNFTEKVSEKLQDKDVQHFLINSRSRSNASIYHRYILVAVSTQSTRLVTNKDYDPIRFWKPGSYRKYTIYDK